MLYEILKTSKLGASFAPDMYTALWAQKLARDGEVKTLSGAPPLSFQANGTPLLDYLISGNTVQSGTPTPQNPVMPNGTGERTGNLWDEEYPNISGTIRYVPLYVGEGSFTLSTTTPYDSSAANLFMLSGNVSTGASTPGNGVWLNHNVTAQSDGGYITIAYRHYTNTTSPADCKTMLNLGSTALPYEPFGVKIPISSANTTTPVYLGEVQTTRKIKKLVLTGEENWTVQAAQGGNRFVLLIQNAIVSDTSRINSMCSHFPLLESGGTYIKALGYTIVNSSIYLRYDPIETVADFKSYLAAQYAAGHPVTMWYVLATPTTGIVNEPLMKIGDYVDSMSRAQTGIDIPTVIGQNTLDVLTDVKPSEIYIKYNRKE